MRHTHSCVYRPRRYNSELSNWQRFQSHTVKQERHYTYNVKMRRSPHHFCRGKAISITYSECVFVALIIRHAMSMRRIILSSAAYSGCTNLLQRYLINGTILGRKVIERKMCVWISSTFLSETFLILRRIQRGIIIHVHRSSCKVPVILVGF
jgi:hypothetical protein